MSYTPEELYEKAKEYIHEVQETPWVKNEAIKSGDYAGQIIHIPTARPLTIHGFCVFAGITTQTFYNYEKQEAYFDIITRIREVFYAQKFEGAAVGAFNPVIIARDLGLREQVESKNENINVNVEPTPEEAKKIKESLDKLI